MVDLLHRADARIGDDVRRLTRRGPATELFMRATTDLGSLFMVVPAGVLLARGRQHRRTAAEMTAAGVLAWAVGQAAKHTFDRRRPYEAAETERLIPEPRGSSMPSGHAAVAAAVATVLASRSRPGRRWQWAVMAAHVPLTRVHLGVHYPGDTLVGAALGYGLGRAVQEMSSWTVAGEAAWKRVAEILRRADVPGPPG